VHQFDARPDRALRPRVLDELRPRESLAHVLRGPVVAAVRADQQFLGLRCERRDDLERPAQLRQPVVRGDADGAGWHLEA